MRLENQNAIKNGERIVSIIKLSHKRQKSDGNREIVKRWDRGALTFVTIRRRDGLWAVEGASTWPDCACSKPKTVWCYVY